MKIEVWSDFVCPFCYIGKRKLELALQDFPHKDQVEVIYKSFELDPYVKTDYSVSIHESLAKKYGMSIEQAKEMNQGVAEQARLVGLNYNFDSMTPTNTFDAHRVAKFAATKGKLAEMTERLLKAYFVESKQIAEHDVLLELAEEVGLERVEVEQVLTSEQFTTEVRMDEAEAQQIGVRGVPFFVLNRKYAISGAQPQEVFQKALQQAWKDLNKEINE